MLAVAAFLILRQDNPAGPILLDIDASDAPRNMIRVRETMPVKPGPFLIRYPEWRPGNHGPTGPLANIVDFQLTPKRFRPGFETQLSRKSLLAVYAAFAIGLAIASGRTSTSARAE